jgi:putative Holliday junction resolvase
MRAVGVDFGRRRIGLAVVETEAGLPAPRPTLSASGALVRDAEALAAFARNEEAGLVVFGLPLLDGRETRFCGVVRRLAALVEGLGLETAFVNEALTSRQAASALRLQGLTGAQAKRRTDSEAACQILEAWLRTRAV